MQGQINRRRLLLALPVIALALLGLWFGLTGFSLSALDEPGRVETYLATKAKRPLVARSARNSSPTPPPTDAAAAIKGQMLFVGRCSACHGIDGRTPTEIGRWLYPYASDLGSPRVQEWSDRELFWIIQNGIRLTGMPGFGKLHSDEDIWALARYVRSLGAQPQE